MTLAQRAYYLQQLGVDSYVPRRFEPKPVVHWEGPTDAQLVFVFQFSQDVIDWSTPAFQLLKKIMDAVQMPQCPMALCYSSKAPWVLPRLAPSTKIITFGAQLLKSPFSRPIETLSLGELQYNDAAKRLLWQALKEIKAIYV